MTQQVQVRQNISRIADFLAGAGAGCRRGDIIRALRFGVSDSTVYRWLETAIEEKMIERTGNTITARYSATSEYRISSVRKSLALPYTQRPRVGYSEAFLESYIPNKTQYLSPEQRSSLHRRSNPGSSALETQTAPDLTAFLCEISYASSKLEGNAHTLAATEALLMHGKIDPTARDVPAKDRIMILNHHDAVSYLVPQVHYPSRENDLSINALDICSIHSLLASGLLESELCGSLRTEKIKISRSAYIPLDIPPLVSRLFHQILDKANEIEDPFEKSFFMIVHLPYLQPFHDCNKRTARVACNIPLLRAGCAPMSWIDTDESEYVEGLFGVYEHREPGLLAQVFTDGYMRSTERLQVLKSMRKPSEIPVLYRMQLREAVRTLVIELREVVPAGVPEGMEADFLRYVGEEVRGMESNPVSGVRFGLTPAEIAAYFGRMGGGGQGDRGHRERLRA